MTPQLLKYATAGGVLCSNAYLVGFSNGCSFTLSNNEKAMSKEKFKKIDKDFLLSDSSLNAYKYRLLTAGYLAAEFAKNPIGYFMHGTDEFPREQGVLVKWEDLRVDGDCVYGKPCINLSHPRGQRTVDEIESGFLNAASMGHFVVLEVSENPEDYVEGQTGVSVSKWFNRECSLVDVPGNFNALTELYDDNNNPLKLADLIANTKIIKMKQIFLTSEQLGLLNLSATAENDAVDTALKNLIAEAKKVPTLTQDLTAATTAKKTAEDALIAFKEAATTKQVEDLVAGGVIAKKMTVAFAERLIKDYAGKPDELKALIADLPVYTGVVANLQSGAASKELQDATWDSLDKAGKLEDLKANNFDLFKDKYKDQFGKEFEGK